MSFQQQQQCSVTILVISLILMTFDELSVCNYVSH